MPRSRDDLKPREYGILGLTLLGSKRQRIPTWLDPWVRWTSRKQGHRNAWFAWRHGTLMLARGSVLDAMVIENSEHFRPCEIVLRPSCQRSGSRCRFLDRPLRGRLPAQVFQGQGEAGEGKPRCPEQASKIQRSGTGQGWVVENQATAGEGLPSSFVPPLDAFASESDAATA